MLDSDLLHRLGTALFHSLWQGAIVVLVAWAVMTLVRRSALRYTIGCIALLAMLMLPVITLSQLPAKIPQQPAVDLAALPLEMAIDDSPGEQSPSPDRGTPAIPLTPERSSSWLPAAAPWLGGLWLVGVVAIGVRHAVGFTLLLRLRRRAAAIVDAELLARVRALAGWLGIARSVAILRSDAIDCPAVIGWLRPAILWPAAAMAGLTSQQLDAILAHELAHIRRHDYAVNLLQTLVETLLFYHPAVWWLSRRIRQEREHCCDDIAAEVVGDRVLYAASLAALESQRQHSRLILAAHGGSLMQRVKRLITPAAAHGLGGRGVAVLLLSLGVALATAWTVHARQEPTTKPAVVDSQTTATPASQPTDYRFKGDDLVQVRIRDLAGAGTESVTNERLTATGKLSLPYLRNIGISGMTEAEAEAVIRKAYKDSGILPDAVVLVIAIERADGRHIPSALKDPATSPASPATGEAATKSIADRDPLYNRLIEERRVRRAKLESLQRTVGKKNPLLIQNQVELEQLEVQIKKYEAALIAEDRIANREEVHDEVRLKSESDSRLLKSREAEMAKVQDQIAELIARKAKIAAEQDAQSALSNLRKLKRDRQEVLDEVARIESVRGKGDPELAELRGLLRYLDVRVQALTQPGGEYYLGGSIGRPGVYSLGSHKITLSQALISAGGLDGVSPADEEFVRVDVVRRVPGEDREERIRFRWTEIRDGQDKLFFLEPGDQVRVDVRKAAPATVPSR